MFLLHYPVGKRQIKVKASEDVYTEVEKLCENGCREVVLTGIETSDYSYGLVELTAKLNKIPRLERIRSVRLIRLS